MPPDFVGLDRFEARKKIIAELANKGLLGNKRPHPVDGPQRRQKQDNNRAIFNGPMVC